MVTYNLAHQRVIAIHIIGSDLADMVERMAAVEGSDIFSVIRGMVNESRHTASFLGAVPDMEYC